MAKKKTRLDRFSDLTWNDMEEWAGSKIVARSRNYQRQGRVSDLAATDDGSLIAWVNGSERYVTKVKMDEDGLPDSICTCPYAIDCKHGVAVVLEYLKRVENDRRVPKVKKGDERLQLLEDEDWHDELDDEDNCLSEDVTKAIRTFLKGKTKAQLIELIHELAEKYPEMAQDLADRRQILSGNVTSLITRLRREIRDISDEPGWQNYWRGEGYTPDYSGIRNKLEVLLKAGHADAMLPLGEELVTSGTRQVEESHDEGETGMEVASCMPVVVNALDKSSLTHADKLAWAVDAVLKDQFEICDAFAQYLYRKHPKAAWHAVADQLLARLKGLKSTKSADDFSRNYERDQISDWAIYALERAERKDEIIPLCKAEAKKTDSYDRLVKRLISSRRHEEAERWIQKGIRVTRGKWPGIASGLRDKLREIRTRQKNWPAVAAMQAEEFVRHPSRKVFTDCKKVAKQVKSWTKVRQCLLEYLERGTLPWEQEGWPLPESGLDVPEADQHNRFPLVDDLIDIAMLEKKPDQVLRWYDQLPKDRRGWYGIDEDKIATSVQSHAPGRAVAIWKNKAERLIGQVKPSAYQEAVQYLRKVAKVMTQVKKQAEWDQYLKGLREEHIRKRRLIEILDGLDGQPIVKKSC
jgi:uncharacterized Zn finger protein